MAWRRFVVVLALARGPAAEAAGPDSAAGKLAYAQNCVACHGLKGTGNGPSGKGLDPKPTDFTTAAPDDAKWFKATKEGSAAVGGGNGMKGFADKLTDEQIRDVLAYCKTFKAK